MRRVLLGLGVATLLLVLATYAKAGFVLSLSSELADLNDLHPGQTITLDVILSGLTSEQVGYLAGTVEFNSSLLGVPTTPTPGAIVPDSSGFFSDSFVNGSTGGADAFYDFLIDSSAPITENGIFFSFQVTAQAVGSGTIDFDPFSLAATDQDNNPLLLDQGTPLHFVIQDGSGGVSSAPAPPSWLLLLTAAASGGMVALVHRLRKRVSADSPTRPRNPASAGL